jgi:peptidyl-tRNA hydrolase
VKVGVGRPADGDVARYVLRPFDHTRRPVMSNAAAEAADTVLQMVRAPKPSSTVESRNKNREEPVATAK